MIGRENLLKFVTHLANSFSGNCKIYLIGQTSQLMEGWINWIGEIEFTADVSEKERAAFNEAIESFKNQRQIKIVEESPADVIPLPEGYPSRHREIHLDDLSSNGSVAFYHFDPYSVAFRYIARGDEPDYNLVINFLKHGFISEEKMNQLLEDLLPRFSFQTIQQDPAEFRRRYKGLLQMWRSQKR